LSTSLLAFDSQVESDPTESQCLLNAHAVKIYLICGDTVEHCRARRVVAAI